MSVKTPVEFERENGQIRAVDKETGESGTGETEEDAVVDLVKSFDNIDDITRTIISASTGIGKSHQIMSQAFLQFFGLDLPDNVDLRQEDEWWVATDPETGVSSQGRTSGEALNNLDEALRGYEGEGRSPTEEELREVGIDPDNNTSGESLPDALQ